ncbi:hypothetical protein BX070DRAFT_229489 [Coemansia spiralis]|nr:hypothetical protein BX070DRAFT_229489 [Coemansia spiralis]
MFLVFSFPIVTLFFTRYIPFASSAFSVLYIFLAAYVFYALHAFYFCCLSNGNCTHYFANYRPVDAYIGIV